MPVVVEAIDQRSIRVPVPCNTDEMEQLRRWVNATADQGYSLKSAAEINGGNQRDPYVIGIRLMAEKKP